MTDPTNSGGWLKWVVGIIVMLIVQLLGVAFASGIVWQKLVSVSEQLVELKTYMREQVQNQYTKLEAKGDVGRINDRLDGIGLRVSRLEKIHLEANN